MNPRMWSHPATRRNLAQLVADGVMVVGPNAGEMAEQGEAGEGRMAEPLEIVAAVAACLGSPPKSAGPLSGYRVLVTAGPTHEPIDPVRYIANRSSGKQGFAIARAAAAAGAEVTLIAGSGDAPRSARHESPPRRDRARHAGRGGRRPAGRCGGVRGRGRRLAGGRSRRARRSRKAGAAAPSLTLVENPDILATVAQRNSERPGLVIGFAAETEHVQANARAKLDRKGCDWIVANDVSPATGIMGGDHNAVQLITREGIELWADAAKQDVAERLIARIAAKLASNEK